MAICRLKRVAADMKGRCAPAHARDRALATASVWPVWGRARRHDGGTGLSPAGYEVTVFDGEAKAGGFMRTQIPRFRLPEQVIDETGYAGLGVSFKAASALIR